MKRENFNLIVNTLDDQALYHEICRKIREVNTISFKLLCLVPIISGLSILTMWLIAEKFSSAVLILTGLFGATITFFIFRWEKRNLQIGDTFRGYAEILETKKINLENEDQSLDASGGPYSLLRHQDKPRLRNSLQNFKTWGKTEAETAIYGTIILFWLLLPIVALLG